MGPFAEYADHFGASIEDGIHPKRRLREEAEISLFRRIILICARAGLPSSGKLTELRDIGYRPIGQIGYF